MATVTAGVATSHVPAIGAALYAAKRHGRPLSTAAIERLRTQSAARPGEFDS